MLLAVLAWLFFKGSKRRSGTRGGPGGRGERSPERMVSCAHCGVHLPESEAVKRGQSYFCCDEHRRLSGG
ncbi:MAG: hypothetical protein Fur0039_24540 [Rhodocyclaceae bacterium]